MISDPDGPTLGDTGAVRYRFSCGKARVVDAAQWTVSLIVPGCAAESQRHGPSFFAVNSIQLTELVTSPQAMVAAVDRSASCTVPRSPETAPPMALMEALIARKDEGHGGIAEVQRRTP